ncbi:MAG TPA: type II toxin-antitoxin system RelE/ParE family toxin [Lysobacter sp.]|nr:type II toxin-antitoxin system RelE/ParE family toxin [Lysobacter sp.]
MIFIETPVFTRQISEMVTDEQYAEFQHLLADSPEAGDVIKGTGGLRKIRLALDNRGKSGGARIIYYYFVNASQIALLFAYPKNVASDLTAEQKAVLKHIIAKWS